MKKKSENYTAIPASAWKGVDDPAPGLHKECFHCGGKNVRDLTMSEMMAVPEERIVNANTYMIPGLAWGYLQCVDCEDQQAASHTDRAA